MGFKVILDVLTFGMEILVMLVRFPFLISRLAGVSRSCSVEILTLKCLID